MAVDGSGARFFDELKRHLREAPSRSLASGGMVLRDAAVLAPLFWRSGEPWVLLTRRPMTLRKHPGQVAFPGGGRDPSDVTLLHTALRETQEELGIAPDDVEVLGMLGTMPTITGYFVTPFVGVIPEGVALTPNPVEIERVLEAPLFRLRRGTRFVYGADRESWEWEGSTDFVWGATFRMLSQLVEHVEALRGL